MTEKTKFMQIESINLFKIFYNLVYTKKLFIKKNK